MKSDELTVTPELSGRALDGVVRALFGLSWGEARSRIASGKVTVDGATRTNARARVRAGSAIGIHMSAPKPRTDNLDGDAIVYLDAHVVVVNKPAGVSTVPYDEGERGTLDERVRALLARRDERTKRGGPPRPPLGVVHRLDKETSGLLVFTRTWLAKKGLASQFRAHTTLRRYLAIAHGDVAPRTICSYFVPNRGDGLRGSFRRSGGSSKEPPGAQRAVTHVATLETLDGATLIACRLETGRTHQIRIHLSEAGHPIVGERVYVRHYEGVQIPAPRLMLHAAELGFTHPATGAPVRWEVPAPADFEETLNRLRSGVATRQRP